jgi:hypothetical protein
MGARVPIAVHFLPQKQTTQQTTFWSSPSDGLRKIEGDGWLEEMVLGAMLSRARRVRD